MVSLLLLLLLLLLLSTPFSGNFRGIFASLKRITLRERRRKPDDEDDGGGRRAERGDAKRNERE